MPISREKRNVLLLLVCQALLQTADRGHHHGERARRPHAAADKSLGHAADLGLDARHHGRHDPGLAHDGPYGRRGRLHARRAVRRDRRALAVVGLIQARSGCFVWRTVFTASIGLRAVLSLRRSRRGERGVQEPRHFLRAHRRRDRRDRRAEPRVASPRDLSASGRRSWRSVRSDRGPVPDRRRVMVLLESAAAGRERKADAPARPLSEIMRQPVFIVALLGRRHRLRRDEPGDDRDAARHGRSPSQHRRRPRS